jgi:hypothetical protein
MAPLLVRLHKVLGLTDKRRAASRGASANGVTGSFMVRIHRVAGREVWPAYPLGKAFTSFFNERWFAAWNCWDFPGIARKRKFPAFTIIHVND